MNKQKTRCFATGFVLINQITPTRCRDLHLKQFCLEDITPAILIILTIHIIIAIRWTLIKILSVVIKGFWKVKTVKQ